MDQNENVTDYGGGNGESTSILIGIVVAIILGILIGGYAPEFAKNFDVLGKIFLNSLKMIVVPLVVLSMIVGITGLGDIRNIGTIGGRTVLYYMVTTAVSVIIGIIMVNIVRPGVGISTGEEHIEYFYTLDGRTVNIGNESWDKKAFKNYEQKGIRNIYLFFLTRMFRVLLNRLLKMRQRSKPGNTLRPMMCTMFKQVILRRLCVQ